MIIIKEMGKLLISDKKRKDACNSVLLDVHQHSSSYMYTV